MVFEDRKSVWRKVEFARRRFKSESRRAIKKKIVEDLQKKGGIYSWRYKKKAEKLKE